MAISGKFHPRTIASMEKSGLLDGVTVEKKPAEGGQIELIISDPASLRTLHERFRRAQAGFKLGEETAAVDDDLFLAPKTHRKLVETVRKAPLIAGSGLNAPALQTILGGDYGRFGK